MSPAGPRFDSGRPATYKKLVKITQLFHVKFDKMDAYKNKRGEQLKPLNVGPRTWLLVSPDKATKERADKFKRDCERSQRMAKNIR